MHTRISPFFLAIFLAACTGHETDTGNNPCDDPEGRSGDECDTDEPFAAQIVVNKVDATAEVVATSPALADPIVCTNNGATATCDVKAADEYTIVTTCNTYAFLDQPADIDENGESVTVDFPAGQLALSPNDDYEDSEEYVWHITTSKTEVPGSICYIGTNAFGITPCATDRNHAHGERTQNELTATIDLTIADDLSTITVHGVNAQGTVFDWVVTRVE